jgi:hypothetical protein
MLVFIPPTMIVAPTVLASFPQFATRMVRLLALAPMVLDRFMEMMIRPRDSLLAAVFSGAQTRRAAEKQKSRQRSTSQRYFSRPKNCGLKVCLHPIAPLHVKWGLKQG